MYDVLEVLQQARETVDACDDEGVAGAQKVEAHLQIGAAIAARFRLFGTDHLASHKQGAASRACRSI